VARLTRWYAGPSRVNCGHLTSETERSDVVQHPRYAGSTVEHRAFMIVQCSVTAGFSWFFASQLLGHDVPYFAAVRELVPDLD
jgi:hypothetical protein